MQNNKEEIQCLEFDVLDPQDEYKVLVEMLEEHCERQNLRMFLRVFPRYPDGKL